MDDLAQRVARGASWLDVKHPGWSAKIDPALLYMGECSMCIIGQLYGSFNVQTYAEGGVLRGIDPVVYGFQLPAGEDDSQNWDALGSLWRAAIAQRLDEEAKR